jgi:hypothetical protein
VGAPEHVVAQALESLAERGLVSENGDRWVVS